MSLSAYELKLEHTPERVLIFYSAFISILKQQGELYLSNMLHYFLESLYGQDVVWLAVGSMDLDPWLQPYLSWIKH